MVKPCTQQITNFDFNVNEGQVVLGLGIWHLQGFTTPIPTPFDVKTTADCANQCLSSSDCVFWWHVAEHTTSPPNDILGCLLFDHISSGHVETNGDTDYSYTVSINGPQNGWYPYVRNTGGGFGVKCSNFEDMTPYYRGLDQCVGDKPDEPTNQLFFPGGVVSGAVPKALAKWSQKEWGDDSNGWLEHPVYVDGCADVCRLNPECKYWAYIPARPDSDEWKETYLCSNWKVLPDGIQDDVDKNNWTDIDGAQFGTACKQWSSDTTTSTTTTKPGIPSRFADLETAIDALKTSVETAIKVVKKTIE